MEQAPETSMSDPCRPGCPACPGSCTLWRVLVQTPGHQLSLSILRALAESWCSFTGINWSITSLTSQASPSISNSFLKMYHVYHKPDHYHSLPHVKQQIHKKIRFWRIFMEVSRKTIARSTGAGRQARVPSTSNMAVCFPHSEGHDMMVFPWYSLFFKGKPTWRFWQMSDGS